MLAAAAEKAGLPRDAVQLVPGTDRASVGYLLRARGLVDLIIPRGGAGLISYVVENASVPVIETGVGNVHVYVDASADLDMAERIVVNAKVSRPSVCNAAETLLVHQDVATEFLPRITSALQVLGVVVHGDEAFRAVDPAVAAATDDDWGTRIPVPRPGREGRRRPGRCDRAHPALVVGPHRGDRHPRPRCGAPVRRSGR